MIHIILAEAVPTEPVLMATFRSYGIYGVLVYEQLVYRLHDRHYGACVSLAEIAKVYPLTDRILMERILQ
jgi:predicted ATP-grasp superfamily ATP-dependent carboligase